MLVGQDILPGIYAGLAGTDPFGSCYWARLKGASGSFDEIIANDNPIGQFYLEVLATDAYLETACKLTPLAEWPVPSAPLESLDPGTYIIGRDISAGTYRGETGQDILDSCYWARLNGVSGDFGQLIANNIANGKFYVEVKVSDFALSIACDLQLVSN